MIAACDTCSASRSQSVAVDRGGATRASWLRRRLTLWGSDALISERQRRGHHGVIYVSSYRGSARWTVPEAEPQCGYPTRVR